MASAKSLDEERLLGTSPRLSPDLLPVHSAAHKVSSTSSRRRWIRIVLFAAMLALITYCALLTNVVPAFAAPWSSPGKNKDALNPYPDGRRLTTTSSGKFKIVLFSDLHYGERDTNNTWAAWADEADAKSTDVMRKALSDESPNFVVFGGDQVTGENTFYNVTGHLDHLLQPVLESKLPFASVYGNHDESYNISHTLSWLHEQDIAPGQSWTQRVVESAEDPKGQFNYFIPLWADSPPKGQGQGQGQGQGGGNKPAALLWFFDSRSSVHNSAQFGVDDEPWMSQDWVDPQSATWVNNTADAMRKAWGTVPPSLVFVHIPPVAAGTIEENVQERPDDYPGINFDTDPGTQDGKADWWHKVNPSHPWWAAVTGTLGANDGLLAVVSGHDHGNDWCGRADSVGPFSFCFARHTGYGGYGNWARGSRVFEFTTKDGALDGLRTWVRMEDHTAANTTTLAEGGRAVLRNSRDAP